jgi:hypothetical protein
MQETEGRADVTIIVPAELIPSIVSAAPSAVVTQAEDDGALGLGQPVKLIIALQEVWKWAKVISAKLAPYIAAKPEMELVMEGPGGRVSIKLKNVSEHLLRESADKVMRRQSELSKRTSRRNTRKRK